MSIWSAILQNSANDILPSISSSALIRVRSTSCWICSSFRFVPTIILSTLKSSPFEMKPSLLISYTLNANFNFSSLEANMSHYLTCRGELTQSCYKLEKRNRAILVFVEYVDQPFYQRVIRQFWVNAEKYLGYRRIHWVLVCHSCRYLACWISCADCAIRLRWLAMKRKVQLSALSWSSSAPSAAPILIYIITFSSFGHDTSLSARPASCLPFFLPVSALVLCERRYH